MRDVKAGVKVGGAALAALTLWMQFVAPAVRHISSQPLSTAPPAGLIALSLGEWPTEPQLSLTFETSGPGPSSSTTVAFLFSAERPSKSDLEILGVIGYGTSIVTCDNENASLSWDKGFEDLNPEQKHMVKQHLREASGRSEDRTPTPPLSELQVSEKASQERYQLLVLRPQPSIRYVSGDDGTTKEQRVSTLDTTCTLAGNAAWTERSPDALFNVPGVSFGMTEVDTYPSSLQVETQISAGPDLSLLRATGVPDSPASTLEKLSWKSPNRGWSNSGESSYISLNGLSALFRSASLEKRNQDALFLAGVSLGIIGSLVIAVLSSLFDFVWLLGATGVRWAGRGLGSFRDALRRN